MKNIPRAVTLGETMAAFTPGSSGPLRYVKDYRMRIAGAESNLAIGLAKLDCPCAWISRLGEDEFGRFVLGSVRAEGVDTSGVVFDRSHRTGIMFKETGAGETKVVYYRENSAASHLCADDLNEDLFAGADLLHLTGITPVLSADCLGAVRRALELARRHALLVSFDPNIRRKLWGERDYTPLIRELTLEADIVLTGLDEGETLFGTGSADALFDTLFQNGRARMIAIKNGAGGAWVADRETRLRLPPHPCRCVEPIGAGDAFDAGFLAGLLAGRDAARCGEMGNIAGALATQTVGDIEGYPSLEELQRILERRQETYR